MNSGPVVRGAGLRRGAWLLLAAMALAGCASSGPGGGKALWILVDLGCNQSHGLVPGLQCMPQQHDAVLKDRCGPTHYLLIPTARRAGVESPELLRDDEPQYFADAWAARDRLIAASGRSDVRAEEIGLAVNSRWGRSQDQLHIHIDFVRPEVLDAVRRWSREGAARPGIELFGHAYRIVHVDSLQRPSPFQRVASAADTPLQRGMNTIAVISDGAAGFYLLFDRADPAKLDRGHAEEVLVPRRCGERADDKTG